MKRIYLVTALFGIAAVTFAAAGHSTNKLRDAYSPVIGLQFGENNIVAGDSDGQSVNASIMLDTKGAISEVKVTKDAKILALPASSYSDVSGSERAWLEERGALDTLVIEGKNEGKEWRLALLFHPRQLWRRRLSIDGQRSDSMIFYDRDEEMKPCETKQRVTSSRGFHRN